jgi:imidazolonepropionase-like amidohydrolase
VQTFSEAELRALVAEAERRGVPVAAHAHGDEGGRAAVAAGVKSIEHGTYLVPTIAVVADLTMPGGDYDDPVLEVRGRHMLPRVREMATAAHRMGIPIVAATDTGYGAESTLRLSEELLELVGIGLTPLAAIQSATSVAAELIGVDDHTGRIAGGYDADLLIVEKNPLDDIGQIRDPLIVINNGRIVLSRLAEAAASDAS